jgi:hypothetical protein
MIKFILKTFFERIVAEICGNSSKFIKYWERVGIKSQHVFFNISDRQNPNELMMRCRNNVDQILKCHPTFLANIKQCTFPDKNVLFSFLQRVVNFLNIEIALYVNQQKYVLKPQKLYTLEKFILRLTDNGEVCSYETYDEDDDDDDVDMHCFDVSPFSNDSKKK